MISAQYLCNLIVTVLEHAPFPSLVQALPLLLGTAAQESGLVHVRQFDNGPARGLWQMEPETETDHLAWIAYHKDIAHAFTERLGVDYGDLTSNIPYQILLARTHYYRRDAYSLPEASDLQKQAELWKRVYNTAHGHGTIREYMHAYERLIRPYVYFPGSENRDRS